MVLAETEDADADKLRRATLAEAGVRKLELPTSFTIPSGWGRHYAKDAKSVPACADYRTVELEAVGWRGDGGMAVASRFRSSSTASSGRSFRKRSMSVVVRADPTRASAPVPPLSSHPESLPSAKARLRKRRKCSWRMRSDIEIEGSAA